ncbi:AlwI family type II restriction endonuclease [Candidatus Uhrbacteria bacterium]|nr:AlwI family type II restriction endonuclease [Candidatus Uhrbacteria bacterium]
MPYQNIYILDRASFLLDAQLLSSLTSGNFTGSSSSVLGTQSWNMPAGSKAILTIEQEQILLSAMSISGGTVTCTIDTRGYNGTTTATHAAGTVIELHLTKAHFDGMQIEIGPVTQGMILQSTVTTVSAANQHTIAGDQTTIFTVGRVYLFKIGSTWYRSIIRSSTYGGGNTTVRSPFRLRDGLVALYGSELQGNLRGKEQDIAFRKLLGEHGIVELGEDKTYSVGRKWRSALTKLGFLYPEIPKSLGIDQAQIGEVDRITPNGLRLIKAETVPAMQECFLRSLAAYVIPSVLEDDYEFSVFSPLQHILKIMLELERETGDSRINFIEMAVVAQLTNSDDDLSEVVHRVLDIRSRRLSSDNKRKFDRVEREKASVVHDYKEQTFNDYADTNIRYLKATGLVQGAGRGISIIPEKHLFIEKFVQQSQMPQSEIAYFTALCNGAALPTDDKDSALVVLDDLLERLKDKNLKLEVKKESLKTPADIGQVRFQAEELLSRANEEKYAIDQAAEWKEIATYMDLISGKLRSATLSEGNQIQVPKAEAAAYFEWVLWRAFLAIV